MRRFAIAEWLGPLIVVELDPAEFDGPDIERLEQKIAQRFPGINVAITAPDWEADSGIRVRGLQAPADVLASPDLPWHELIIPEEDELPF